METIEKVRKRYSMEELIARNQPALITQPSQEVLNKLMKYRLTRRTWAEKTAKKAKHAKRRRRKIDVDKICKHLPTILNLNSRSICNKKEDLKQVLDDTKIDVAVITETWLTNENETVQISEIRRNNPDYEVFSKKRERTDVNRGGGVMVLVNKNYATSKEVETAEIQTDNQLLESITIAVNPKRKPRGFSNCFITGVYIPPGGNGGNKDKEMKEAVKQLNNKITETSQLKSPNPLLFILGDTNGVDLKPINRTHGTYQINKKATRKAKKQKEQLLDPILTNAPRCYRCINLPKLGNSDHEMIKAIPQAKEYAKTRPEAVTVTFRSGKIEDTVEELGNIEWKHLINSTEHDLQTKFNIFYETVKDVLDTCQPMRTARLKGDQKWMTVEIKKEIKHRQKLWHRKMYDEWKVQANKVTKMIKKRKRSYYKRFTNKNTNWWDEVNQIREPRQTNSISEDMTIKLNNYFHSVWTNDSTAPKNTTKRISCNDKMENKRHIKLLEHEIIEELNKLDVKKAAGPDELNARVLKAARFELAPVITFLFNESIKQSFIPEQWKEANIAPVPKVQKPAKPEDFRPVALTSTLCKVLERILAKYIVNNTKEIWKNNNQFGFLPGKSTKDALLQVIEDWTKAIDNNESIMAVFFDFSKAFDLVDHDLLLRKLEAYLPEWIIKWVEAYLKNRKQRVKTANHTAEWKQVEAGVIQGSVLGPILFIIFLADINEYIPDGIIAPKYADDILTYSISKNNNLKQIQEAVNGVERWSNENQMKLNTKKTQVMCINNKSDDQVVMLNQTPLAQTESYKYLGTYVNNKLTWDEQWHHISKRFNSTLYLIKTMKKLGFQKAILVNIYKSLILSQVISNSTVLCSANKSIADEIQHIQEKVLKVIDIKKEEEDKFKIEPTSAVIEKHCKSTMSKILNNPDHNITKSLKTKEIIRTRNKFPYQIGKCNKQIYQQSFVQQYLRKLEAENEIHIKPSENNNKPVQEIDKTSIQGHKCETCDKICLSKAGLKAHERLKHMYQHVTIRRK